MLTEDECDEIHTLAVEYLRDSGELSSRIHAHAEARYHEMSQYIDLISSI
jgi:hypothetical protein